VTRRDALRHARKILESHNIADAVLEAELLLRYSLGVNRTQLHTEPDEELTPQQSADFRRCIERRLNNEPSAYITGHREFFGLDFLVDSNVLIPRPETELLVEKTIEVARGLSAPVIVDVGTGSGAIAVSLAIHLPDVRVLATDISASALEVARHNSTRHGVEGRIDLLCGDLLEPVSGKADIVVSNPPYVKESDLPSVNTSGFEPSLALDGGREGLDTIRRLVSRVEAKLKPRGYLLMEIGAGQLTAVTGLLRQNFPDTLIEIFPDLAGIDRVVVMQYLSAIGIPE